MISFSFDITETKFYSPEFLNYFRQWFNIICIDYQLLIIHIEISHEINQLFFAALVTNWNRICVKSCDNRFIILSW